MLEGPSARYRRLLAGWVRAMARGPRLVMIVALVATVAAAAHVATNLRINTNTSDLLSPDLDFRRYERQIDAAFPLYENNLLVVIDGVTQDLADDAADRLREALRARTTLFNAVLDLQGDDFFRQNGLLYLDLESLDELAGRLVEAQPFLARLWRDPSLRGLSGVLKLAAGQAGAGGEMGRRLAPMLDAMAEVAEAQAEGLFRALSWTRLMTGDDSHTRRVLRVQPKLDHGSLRPAIDAMAGVRKAAQDLGLEAKAGVRVRLSGSVALEQEELASVERGMGIAGGLSVTLVLVLLFLCFRSVRMVAATLVALIMGLVWTAAFAVVAVGAWNLISVAFAVLFVGLSVDFAIHFGLSYREKLAAGLAHEDALAAAAAGVGGPLTLAAAAAAVAFYSFLPTAYVGLAELGLIAGTGMFIALFANLTVVPAMLSLFPPKAVVGGPPLGQAAAAPTEISDKAARWIVWTAVAVGVGAALLAARSQFDFDPLNLKDPNSESVITLNEMMSGEGGARAYAVSVLAADLGEANRLARRLQALPEVASAGTLSDFVPTGQQAKLDIIGDMAFVLEPSLAGDAGSGVLSPETRRRAGREMAAHARALGAAGGASASAARRLATALAGLEGAGDDGLAHFGRRVLGGLKERLRTLRRSLSAHGFDAAALPPAIKGAALAADGRALITVVPAADPGDLGALRRFADAVRAVAPRATGNAITIVEAGRAVVRAFWQAGALAAGVIVLLVFAALGRLSGVALVFAPLILAALLTAAFGVIAGLPFNFANIIVLPLLFGLGVAGSIHLVARHKAAGTVGQLWRTCTPRAVLFSALTTIGSFGSIALSGHPGTASMGVLLAVAVSMSLLCTLVVLPALMVVWRSNRQGDGA